MKTPEEILESTQGFHATFIDLADRLSALAGRMVNDLFVVTDALVKANARVDALLKENAQLRDQIAGNDRPLPPGTSLELQLKAVFESTAHIGKYAMEGRLRSVAMFWDEGKAVVTHAKVAPAPLIVLPS